MNPTLRPALHELDFNCCADIWLQSSLSAHSFAPSGLWEERRNAMAAHYLPMSITEIAEINCKAVGFSARIDTFLHALFVLPDFWGKGIGTILLESAAVCSSRLELKVYPRNKRALRFYTRHGFMPEGEAVCPLTGEPELFLTRG